MEPEPTEPILRDAAPTECPRCGGGLADQDFYGVCGACQVDLRATFSGEQRAVTPDAYEPKMNVTPNAVASKD